MIVEGKRGISAAVVGIERDRLFEIRDGFDVVLWRRAAEMLLPAQECIVGGGHRGFLLTQNLLILVGQAQRQRLGDAARDLVLE